MKRIALVSTLLLVGCTEAAKPQCGALAPFTNAAADGVAKVLQCKNVEAVRASFLAEIEKRKVCLAPSEQFVMDFVCKKVAEFAKKKVMEMATPSEWECSGGVVADQIEKVAFDQCKNAL